jgi:hypothetical protein
MTAARTDKGGGKKDMTLYVGRTLTGLPTVAEHGGGATNTGNCLIVCGERGEKLRPIFKKSRAFEDHAIFEVRRGQHIIEQRHSREGERIEVWRIEGVGADDSLQLSQVGEWENGTGNIPEYLKEAASAASEKGRCYHCRHSHYSSD